ncbi:MAG: hypothetical protein AABX17_01445 [Nanoarchaeota archaeon]
MTKNNDFSGLPPLPPLEDVLKAVRSQDTPKSDNGIDYKKKYEALKKTVDALQKKLEEPERQIEALPSSKQENRTCPILQKNTGSGEISVISNSGLKKVACPSLYDRNNLLNQIRGIEGEPFCDFTNKPCPYSI